VPLEAYTTDFGTTSSDCPPDSGKNISGSGLAINFYPSTSETVNLPATLNCSWPGFELYKCPCPQRADCSRSRTTARARVTPELSAARAAVRAPATSVDASRSVRAA
jgi:hypothetical protein